MEKNRGTAWWMLYLIVAVGIGLLILECGAPLSSAGHEVMELGILLLIYGSAAFWLRSNRSGLVQPKERLGSRARRQPRNTFYPARMRPPEAATATGATSRYESSQRRED